MMKTGIRILFSLALALWQSQVFSDAAWHAGLNKNGIRIETRAVSGSAYKQFRATMLVRADIARAIAVMEDFAGYVKWMKDCKTARHLRRLSATAGIVYTLQATPWPIAEREAVVRYDFARAPGRVRIELAAAPDALPENSGKVRISKLSGYWTFTEKEAGHMEVVYSLHSEPGGNLPSWAAAGMVEHLPYETLLKLRKVLEAADASASSH